MALTQDERAAVNAAIGQAEEGTAGEILCVISEEASDYREVPLAVGAFAALVLPALIMLFGAWTAFDWTVAHIAAARAAAITSAAYLLAAQALLFVVAALLTSIPVMRRALTPRALKRERVRRRALEQFLAKDLHRTRARTGVLIYVSLRDRMAELIADEGVRDRIPPEAWEAPMRALVDRMREGALQQGLVGAIEKVGALLAEHVPAGAINENELPDAVAELP